MDTNPSRSVKLDSVKPFLSVQTNNQPNRQTDRHTYIHTYIKAKYNTFLLSLSRKTLQFGKLKLPCTFQKHVDVIVIIRI